MISKNFLKKLFSLLLVFSLFAFQSSLVLAQEDQAPLSKDLQSRTSDRTSKFALASGFQKIELSDFVAVIIQLFLSILAMLFFALMVFGGYKWLMARGNEEQVETARGIIRHAIIGIVITVSAYALAYFIILWLSTAAGSGPASP